MKLSVNVELTDSEIRELAGDVARRLLVEGAKQLGEEMERTFTPESVGKLLDVLGPVVQQVRRAGVGRGAHAHAGPPFAGPFAGPGPSGVASKVSPIGGSSPVVEHCFFIEATKQLEAGWGCCKCATYNGLQRTACRTCGHAACGAIRAGEGPSGPIVTPWPGAQPPTGPWPGQPPSGPLGSPPVKLPPDGEG